MTKMAEKAYPLGPHISHTYIAHIRGEHPLPPHPQGWNVAQAMKKGWRKRSRCEREMWAKLTFFPWHCLAPEVAVIGCCLSVEIENWPIKDHPLIVVDSNPRGLTTRSIMSKWRRFFEEEKQTTTFICTLLVSKERCLIYITNALYMYVKTNLVYNRDGFFY